MSPSVATSGLLIALLSCYLLKAAEGQCQCPHRLGVYEPPFLACGHEINQIHENNECNEQSIYFCLRHETWSKQSHKFTKVLPCQDGKYCGVDAGCTRRRKGEDDCMLFKTSRHCFRNSNTVFKEQSISDMMNDEFKYKKPAPKPQ